MREKEKSFLSVPSQSKVGNSKKIAKNSKNQKTSLCLLLNLKRDGTGLEWEKKNILVPIHSNPTRNRKFQKNSKKMQKIKKHYYGFISTQNEVGQAEIERKKIHRYDPFILDPE